MSEREQAKQIIDQLLEYMIGNLLLFEDYLNNPDSEKHETITIEELAV